MQRKDFIKQCSFACLGLMGLSAIVESCGTSKSLSGNIDGSKKLSIPLTSFLRSSKSNKYNSYIVVRNDSLNYPIVVYRNGENTYTALLLRCSHQQNELSVSGELLTCPAHGSSFNMKGEVVNGPAEMKLREFPTSSDAQNLYIDLS